jgi:hypothetical protein
MAGFLGLDELFKGRHFRSLHAIAGRSSAQIRCEPVTPHGVLVIRRRLFLAISRS